MTVELEVAGAGGGSGGGRGDGQQVEITRLAADVPWAANTAEEPERIAPRQEHAPYRDGKLTLEIAPFSIVQVRLPV